MRGVERNGLPHDADKLIALFVKARQNGVFELVVEIGGVSLGAFGGVNGRVVSVGIIFRPLAFLQIHFLAGVRDMVKLNELLFFGDSRAA